MHWTWDNSNKQFRWFWNLRSWSREVFVTVHGVHSVSLAAVIVCHLPICEPLNEFSLKASSHSFWKKCLGLTLQWNPQNCLHVAVKPVYVIVWPCWFPLNLECASYGNTATSLFKKNLVGLSFRHKLLEPVLSKGLEIELDSGTISLALALISIIWVDPDFQI